jgi:hypothetical protein
MGSDSRLTITYYQIRYKFLEVWVAGDIYEAKIKKILAILYLRGGLSDHNLQRFTAGADRPDHLDLLIANANVPVVDIAGRVAMTGDQAQFIPDLQCAVWIYDHAMLVRRSQVRQVGTAEDNRQTRVHRLHLQPCVADRHVRFFMTDDHCQYE